MSTATHYALRIDGTLGTVKHDSKGDAFAVKRRLQGPGRIHERAVIEVVRVTVTTKVVKS